MRRREFISWFGAGALAPLAGLPARAAPADGCSVPSARNDGLAIASVDDRKLIDRDALCMMADRLVVVR